VGLDDPPSRTRASSNRLRCRAKPRSSVDIASMRFFGIGEIS
jgi:hypothetical protein